MINLNNLMYMSKRKRDLQEGPADPHFIFLNVVMFIYDKIDKPNVIETASSIHGYDVIRNTYKWPAKILSYQKRIASPGKSRHKQ